MVSFDSGKRAGFKAIQFFRATRIFGRTADQFSAAARAPNLESPGWRPAQKMSAADGVRRLQRTFSSFPLSAARVTIGA